MTKEVQTVNVSEELHGKLKELLDIAPVEADGDGANRIALMILSSETLDDVAAIFSGMNNAEQYLDKELLIDSFVVRESTFKDGIGAYATITARLYDTQETIAFNCGSVAVMSVLLLANKRHWFPLKAHLTSKTTTSGNTVYNLIPDE